jgi:hypothetical protein
MTQPRQFSQAEAIATGSRYRETASCDDESVSVDWGRPLTLDAPTIVMWCEAHDDTVQAQRRAGTDCIREQSIADVSGLVRYREELRGFWFLGKRQAKLVFKERDLLGQWPRPQNLPEQMRRGICDEARFVDVHRQHVAATATADQDLPTAIASALDERGRGASRGGKNGRHRAGGTCADDDDAPRRLRSDR